MNPYQPLEPLDLTKSNYDPNPSRDYIGLDKGVYQGGENPQEIYLVAQKLAKITGKPLEYCLNEFGYTLNQNANG